MNNIDFLNEALNSPNCPNDFKDTYLKFCKYQKIVFETLKQFIYVCEKNAIQYQLAFGTLLGAIRDHEQIPWDYDIDIFIHFEDRKKLLNALKKDLNKKYYYTCGEIDNVEQFFIRIAPRGYNTDIIHVDVFYYIGFPNDEKEFKNHEKIIRELLFAREAKILPLYGTKKNKIKMLFLRIKYFNIPLDVIIKKIVDNCEKYNSYFSPKVCNCNSTCGLKYYPQFYIKDTIYKIMSGIQVMVPKEYKQILQQEYNNYNEYLPVENRINEVIYFYNNIINNK